MDAELNLILCPFTGKTVPLHMKKSDTVRSVVEAARIPVPPNTQLICVSHGNQLQLDLSLGIQGIKSNDTIVVLCKKLGRTPNSRNSSNLDNSNITGQNIQNVSRLDVFEEQQKSLFEEALRVSDLSFLLFDYYRTSSTVYQEILSQQEEQFSDTSEEDDYPSQLPENPHISEDPLPTCWGTQSQIYAFEDQQINYLPPLHYHNGLHSIHNPQNNGSNNPSSKEDPLNEVNGRKKT
ncbi:hypothetical protein TRFO_10386 [Tritrichomonas foetus]|uniref:Ubiquitin-like domain-containing protein n=1 Tax=Tritrichomonas foetus TaxID=1144522 RepID=A0A1J4JE69_9EUKA|nr:hypothetical protein TRFO_10386 [Tritrichomonas foetus]|eukprot:OHS95733.1 hypothetical protein TRFO_10386 [Tritrichomonas foetus]